MLKASLACITIDNQDWFAPQITFTAKYCYVQISLMLELSSGDV